MALGGEVRRLHPQTLLSAPRTHLSPSPSTRGDEVSPSTRGGGLTLHQGGGLTLHLSALTLQGGGLTLVSSPFTPALRWLQIHTQRSQHRTTRDPSPRRQEYSRGARGARGARGGAVGSCFGMLEQLVCYWRAASGVNL